jgi:hypothetical protein
MSLLVSHSLDAEPDWAARFGMAVHRALCPNCRRYDQQIRWVHAAASQLATHAPVDSRRVASEPLKPSPPPTSPTPDDLRS